PAMFAVDAESTVLQLKEHLSQDGGRAVASVRLDAEELDDEHSIADMAGKEVQVTYEDESTATVLLKAKHGACCA
ncbi:hypothetical protein IWQ57_002542, partial [Coemansia nantahalensis]